MNVIVELSYSAYETGDAPSAALIDISKDAARLFLGTLADARKLRRDNPSVYNITLWAWPPMQLFYSWEDCDTPLEGAVWDEEIPEGSIESDWTIHYMVTDCVLFDTDNIGEDYVRFRGGFSHGHLEFCSARIYRDVLEDIARSE